MVQPGSGECVDEGLRSERGEGWTMGNVFEMEKGCVGDVFYRREGLIKHDQGYGLGGKGAWWSRFEEVGLKLGF